MAGSFDCWGDPEHFLPPLTSPLFFHSRFFPPLFLSVFRTLSPSSRFLELIFRMISWPQNVLIAESWSPSLRGYFLGLVFQYVCFHMCVCVCVCVCKGGKLGFGVGQGVIRQGYLSFWWTSEGPDCPCAPDLLLQLSNTPTSHSVRQLNPGGGDKTCVCVRVWVCVPKSDIEQGLLHRETSKGRNNTLKLCSQCLGQCLKVTQAYFCMLCTREECTLSSSVCNYVIWRQVYLFSSLFPIAQFEGNDFCLPAYAIAYTRVRAAFVHVCVLRVTRHYLHTLFLISHFTHFLSSAANRKMEKTGGSSWWEWNWKMKRSRVAEEEGALSMVWPSDAWWKPITVETARISRPHHNPSKQTHTVHAHTHTHTGTVTSVLLFAWDLYC